MTKCNCGSERVALLTAKCSDCCGVSLGHRDMDGYVPSDMGIGGGDYVTFEYCLDCGKISGEFPLPLCTMEQPVACQRCGEPINHADAEDMANAKSNIYCEDCI